MLKINAEKCKGCTLCIKTCPTAALSMDNKIAVVDLDKCILCGACISSCKFDALSIEINKQAKEDLSTYKGVWVFGEQREGKISEVSLELIGIGRKLADDRNEKLSVIVFGDNLSKTAELLADYPVDQVYVYDAPELKDFDSERYCRIFTDVVREYKPEIILAGATTTGRSLMSGVAINVYTGLTADCTGLEIGEDGLLHQTRPAYGGNIMATILCPYSRPQMATVRHKVFPLPAKRESGKAEIINLTTKPHLFASKSKVLDFIETVGENVNLVDANIIISGGRGMGCAENFSVIKELAHEIGAAVGASRAAVDSGWMSYAHQVGQTGKTVCPKIYIACGISGAVQHLAGMSSSDVIIAINKDKDATIFQYADYGFVGDALEVLPGLIRKIKSARGAL